MTAPSHECRDDEIEDFLLGSGLLSGGGGGGEEYARFFLLDDIRARSKAIRLVGLEELPDEELVFRPFFLGSKPRFEEIQAFLERRGFDPTNYQICLAHADDLLRQHFGRGPTAYLPAEIGPTNAMAAMYLAALADLPTIDRDCVGRAVPELCLDLPSLRGLPMAPLAIATELGDRLMVHEICDAERFEAVARQLARQSGGIVAVVNAYHVRELRSATLPGTVRRAIRLGYEIRASLEENRPPLERLLARGLAVSLFRGRIAASRVDLEDGFVVGEHLVHGSERGSAPICRISFRNENLVMWRDERPFATCPDVITLVDEQTGRPLFNDQNDHREGRAVVVLGIPAAEIWRTNGRTRLGPRRFGFPFEPIPVDGPAVRR